MLTSSDTARSDVVLAAAGVWVGAGLFGLVARTGLVPGGLLGSLVVLVVTAAVMVVWPMWLARARTDTVMGARFAPDQLGTGVVVAVPLLLAGILAGVAVSGGVAGDLVQRTTTLLVDPILPMPLDSMTPGQLVGRATAVIGAVGTGLVVVLIARRGPSAWGGPSVSTKEVLRTWALGAAAVATVLRWLALVRPLGLSTGLLHAGLLGLGLLALVLLTDALVPATRVQRTGALVPGIAVLVLWVLRGGLFFGGDLLGDLSAGMLATTIALCMGQLVTAGRTWAALPIPVIAALWMGGRLLPGLG